MNPPIASVYRVASLAAVLCSCAAGTDDLEPQPTARFASRPVVVQASAALPDECVESLLADIFWYRDQGVTFAISMVEPDAPSILGIPVGGVVAVHEGALTEPDALAETWPSLTIGGNVFYADVTLKTCDQRAIAHELGHALGLADSTIRGNLMIRGYELGGWDLTELQLAWITD